VNEAQYIQLLFEKAGWHEGRHVEFEPSVQPKNPSEERGFAILHEFGGLNVGETGAGRELAASNIRFPWQPGDEHKSIVSGWESSTGDLCAIAEVHNDHGILFIGVDGDCYLYGIPGGHLCSCGSNFDESSRRLLLGINFEPNGWGREVE
jgi:hypothetical protein